MGWISQGKKPITYRGSSYEAPFTGTAELFAWDGENPSVKKSHAHYAAVIQLDSPPEEAVQTWAGGAGYIGAAVKAAFPQIRRSRLGGAKADHTDWGAPIGKPADNKTWYQGLGSLTFRVPGRASTSAARVARRYASESVNGG